MATKSIRMSDGSNTLLPESATSANGYQKCADGTLIQWGFPAQNVSAGDTITYTITFSQTFIATPTVVVSSLAHAPAVFNVSVENVLTNQFDARIRNNYNQALVASIPWIAIGRWK